MRRNVKTKVELGFTLIELLIVIAIIGLVATITVVSLSSTVNNAKFSKSLANINPILKAINIARSQTNKTLLQITQSGCSDCGCRGRDIRNIATTDPCYISWITAVTKIEDASVGAGSGLANIQRDAWGSPYGLDENERESGPNDCRTDSLRSAGPDGMLYTSDDQTYFIPLNSSCP